MGKFSDLTDVYMNLRTSFLVARFPEAPRITMTVFALSLWLMEVRLLAHTKIISPVETTLKVFERNHSLCEDEG